MAKRPDAGNGMLLFLVVCFVVLIAGLTIGYATTHSLGWSLLIGLSSFAACFGLFWLKLTR